MKTVLIPIFHGHTARNLLRTQVLSLLSKEARVVLLVPPAKVDLYHRDFASDQVIIEPSPVIKHSKLDHFFRNFYYYFVDTNTVRIIQGEQFLLTNRRWRYWRARILTKIFGHSRLLRRLVRWLDSLLVKDHLFGEIFNHYQPDLAFIPSITSDDECLVLRQARARGIKTVAMVRSWDNITVNKGNIRVFPDRLLLHSELLKQDVIRYADYPAKQVVVVGMSHFDHYFSDNFLPCEEFFRNLGGDPKKKTIFLTLIGLSGRAVDERILKALESAAQNGGVLAGAQIIVRPHPNDNKPITVADPNTTLINTPAMIDYPGAKLTDREFTPQDITFLANAFYHSDVVVNVQSTTTIDAAAFDKPIVNVAFDEVGDKNYLLSVKRFYDFDHYQPILASGGVKVARNESELVNYVADYLAHPEHEREGRRRLLLEQNGGVADSLASQRTVRALLDS
jgi:hypothetical protein